MVDRVKALAKDWKYDRVSMGYPGPVIHNRPVAEPHNLGQGWVGFDFEAAFERPIKVMNDAAMQALGSYKGGKMLFLGLGTGLGSTMIVGWRRRADGARASALPQGHLRGLRRLARATVHGEKKWRKHVEDVIERLVAALEPDDVVLGGGNVKHLHDLPKGTRAGDNANAFLGGFRAWEKQTAKGGQDARERLRQRIT